MPADQPEDENVDLPLIDDDVERGLPSRTRTLPWSDRTILLVSLLVVLVLSPIWLEPNAVLHLVGIDGQSSSTPASVLTPTRGPAPNETVEPLSNTSIVVSDDFARVIDDGWGTADVGGPYVEHGTGALTVSAGTATIVAGPGSQGYVDIDAVNARDVVVEHDVAVDALPDIESVDDITVLRHVDLGDYEVVVRFAGSDVSVGVERNLGGATETIDHFVYVGSTAGTVTLPLRVRAQATGSEPSIIRVQAWSTADSEPATWQLSVVDWAGALEHSGSIGLGWSTDANTSSALHIDNLTAWAVED